MQAQVPVRALLRNPLRALPHHGVRPRWPWVAQKSRCLHACCCPDVSLTLYESTPYHRVIVESPQRQSTSLLLPLQQDQSAFQLAARAGRKLYLDRVFYYSTVRVKLVTAAILESKISSQLWLATPYYTVTRKNSTLLS